MIAGEWGTAPRATSVEAMRVALLEEDVTSTPADAAAARRVLAGQGATDLLVMLGLDKGKP